MVSKRDRLLELAERIRFGDLQAEDAFREEAHPGMVVHLRYALCIRQDHCLLEVRARREAVRLRRDPRWRIALGREYLIQQLARQLCEDVIVRLHSNRSATRVLEETLLN